MREQTKEEGKCPAPGGIRTLNLTITRYSTAIYMISYMEMKDHTIYSDYFNIFLHLIVHKRR